MTDVADFRIIGAGDSVIIVEFEARIDPRINARAVAVAGTLRASGLQGVRDVVPTFRSVAVYFDPIRTDYDALLEQVTGAARKPVPGPDAEPVPIRIPVRYGGADGPDLPFVASQAGLTEEEVVSLYCGVTYRVFMLGFVPGFAYLGSVDPRIATRRLATPRLRVPAGSVGIAERQTGVYPLETPGGWQLIGRTPVRILDLSRSDPFLLKTGDAVQFFRVE